MSKGIRCSRCGRGIPGAAPSVGPVAAFVAEHRGQSPLPFVAPAPVPSVTCHRCRGPVRRARMVLLVQRLYEAAPGSVTAEDLAELTGATARTIYRDVAQLRLLGVPIRAAAGVGYALPRTAPTASGLTVCEVWAVAPRLAGWDTSLAQAAGRDKLLAMLPGPLVQASVATIDGFLEELCSPQSTTPRFDLVFEVRR